MVWVGNKSAHNTSSRTSSWKIYHTKTSIVALLSTSVGLSVWIAYHGDSLILSNNCALLSSAISSFHLGMVLAERGTHATYWTAVSPKSSWQRSLAAGRINSSPRVKGSLALAMRWATKSDVLSAGTLDKGAAFHKASPCAKAVLKVSWLHWIAGHHIIYKVGLKNVNYLLQWTHNLSRTLGTFF